MLAVKTNTILPSTGGPNLLRRPDPELSGGGPPLPLKYDGFSNEMPLSDEAAADNEPPPPAR